MTKKTVSCKYNQECWVKVRLPKIRNLRAPDGGKIYLPYECSFVTMGDMEKCTIRDGFIAREEQQGVKEINDVSTDGAVRVDI